MATPEPSSYDIGDRQQGNNLYRNKTLKIQENMDCKNQLFELYKKGLITENELTTALKEFTKVNEDFKELKKMQDIEAVAKDLYKSVASFTDMHGECGLITAFSKLLNDYCYMASNIQN